MKHPQPVLVLSTGRTGTKFLASLLSNHFPKSARTQHESSRTRPINILTNMYFAGFIPKVFLPMTWKLLKQRELSKTELDFYIDINNFLYGIPVIEPELYPNLKVVHIIRDPRTYVRSHINWAHQNTKSFIANFWLPFWQPSPLFTGENFVGPRLLKDFVGFGPSRIGSLRLSRRARSPIIALGMKICSFHLSQRKP